MVLLVWYCWLAVAGRLSARISLDTQRRENGNFKNWIGARLDTPEKARTFISNVALGGGVVGLILLLLAVLSAHG